MTKFYGRNRGIDDLSISVERGEIFGFLGPNGAGKSTTIRALLGLQHPNRGRATILGLDAWHQNKRDVHRHVGYLPGEVTLLNNLAKFGVETAPNSGDAMSVALASSRTSFGSGLVLPRRIDLVTVHA